MAVGISFYIIKIKGEIKPPIRILAAVAIRFDSILIRKGDER